MICCARTTTIHSTMTALKISWELIVVHMMIGRHRNSVDETNAYLDSKLLVEDGKAFLEGRIEVEAPVL